MITATPTREIDRVRIRLRRLEIAHRTARHREQGPHSRSDLDRILDLNLPVDQWSRIERIDPKEYVSQHPALDV